MEDGGPLVVFFFFLFFLSKSFCFHVGSWFETFVKLFFVSVFSVRMFCKWSLFFLRIGVQI